MNGGSKIKNGKTLFKKVPSTNKNSQHMGKKCLFCLFEVSFSKKKYFRKKKV
jgi:hypothetical protein